MESVPAQESRRGVMQRLAAGEERVQSAAPLLKKPLGGQLQVSAVEDSTKQVPIRGRSVAAAWSPSNSEFAIGERGRVQIRDGETVAILRIQSNQN